MALTLGTTGMDSSTQADVTTAFKTANADLGGHWSLVPDDNADYVVVDMDSLYGPMSWMRLHTAGRKVIGLTSVERSQTDYRLMRPINARDFAVLLSEIAGDAPPAHAAAAPSASTPAPAPSDKLPEAQALPEPKAKPASATKPVMASAPATTAKPDPIAEPAPSADLLPDRTLASWLTGNKLVDPVRLKRSDSPLLLIDPGNKTYYGPASLKSMTPCFAGSLTIKDFQQPDAAAWEAEAAKLGEAQPLARLQWLGGLLAGRGKLLPGYDANGHYSLTKWPQTEREYPKHFRIATAMMKGPSTLDEIAAASGADLAEVADFINANLLTGYAERARPGASDPEPPTKPSGGLFGRMRGR